jgi:hypothetical protein
MFAACPLFVSEHYLDNREGCASGAPCQYGMGPNPSHRLGQAGPEETFCDFDKVCLKTLWHSSAVRDGIEALVKGRHRIFPRTVHFRSRNVELTVRRTTGILGQQNELREVPFLSYRLRPL